ECGSRFHVGPDEGLQRRGRIVGDRGEAEATGAGVEIFAVFTARLGLVGVAVDDLDSANYEDFASIAGLEKSVAFTKWDFRLIDFNNAFERLPIWIDHGSTQFLRQQPSSLVSDSQLVLQLTRRHAIGMG